MSLTLYFAYKYITRSKSKGQTGHPFGITPHSFQDPEHRSLTTSASVFTFELRIHCPPHLLMCVRGGKWGVLPFSLQSPNSKDGGLSDLYDIGIILYCAQHHPSCLDIQVVSRSFIIALVLEQLLTLSQRHLCRPENGCALSFLRLTCLGQIYVLGEVSLSFIFGLERCGPMLFAATALPDTNPVIFESPRKPLSVPEQAFYLQCFCNTSLTQLWHPNHVPSF